MLGLYMLADAANAFRQDLVLWSMEHVDRWNGQQNAQLRSTICVMARERA